MTTVADMTAVADMTTVAGMTAPLLALLLLLT